MDLTASATDQESPTDWTTSLPWWTWQRSRPVRRGFLVRSTGRQVHSRVRQVRSSHRVEHRGESCKEPSCPFHRTVHQVQCRCHQA